MSELGISKAQKQLLKLRETERKLAEKTSGVNTPQKEKISIDEIIERVEEGDLHVLAEAEVHYTVMRMDLYLKKVTFEYENAKFVIYIDESKNKEKSDKTDVIDKILPDDNSKQSKHENSASNKLSDLSSLDFGGFASLIKNLQMGATSLKDLKRIQKQLKTMLDDIYRKIASLSLSIPTPPNVADFQKSDGSIDNRAYDEALNKYLNQYLIFNRILDELNKKAELIKEKLEEIEKHMNGMAFKQTHKDV